MITIFHEIYLCIETSFSPNDHDLLKMNDDHDLLMNDDQNLLKMND
jgi:hypothetical protein